MRFFSPSDFSVSRQGTVRVQEGSDGVQARMRSQSQLRAWGWVSLMLSCDWRGGTSRAARWRRGRSCVGRDGEEARKPAFVGGCPRAEAGGPGQDRTFRRIYPPGGY